MKLRLFGSGLRYSAAMLLVLAGCSETAPWRSGTGLWTGIGASSEASEKLETVSRATPSTPVNISTTSLPRVDADVPTRGIIDQQTFKPASVVSTKASEFVKLKSVIAQTLRENPDIGIVTAQAEDADLGVEVAKADRLGTIDLSATTGIERSVTESTSVSGVNATEVSLSAERVIYDFGSRENTVSSNRRTAQAATFRREDTLESVALDVLSSYLEVQRSSKLAAAARRNVSSHQRIANLVSLNEQGGNATKADVTRAQTRLESARSEKLNVENSSIDAVTSFERLTGKNPKKVLPFKLNTTPPKSARAADMRKLVQKNPQLQSLISDRQALEKRLEQQRAALRPEIYVRGEANYRNDVGGETGEATDLKGLIGLRVQLYDGGSRKLEIRRTRAQIKEVNEQARQLTRDLLEQMEENTQELSTARTKTGFVNDRVRTARQSLALSTEQFEGGERTAFELLDAQRDLYQAEIEQINHVTDTQVEVYQNLRLSGMLIATLFPTGFE